MAGAVTGVFTWLSAALVLGWAVALTVHDLRERRLPDVLTLPAVPVVWTAAALCAHGAAVLGGVGWFLLCVLPGRWSPRLRAGGGDAKLALSLGCAATAAAGPVGLAAAVTGASVVTLLYGAVAATVTGRVAGRGRRSRGAGLPHGPGMLTATLAVVVVSVVLNGGWW